MKALRKRFLSAAIQKLNETILHHFIKKSKEFCRQITLPAKFLQFPSVRQICNLIDRERYAAVYKVSALSHNAENGRRARYLNRHAERYGGRIRRRVESMLDNRPGDDSAVLLELENNVERKIHPRCRRKISVECNRIDTGFEHGKITAARRMSDTRTRRCAVRIEKQRIPCRTGRRRRRISGKKLRSSRRTRRSRRSRGACCTCRACHSRRSRGTRRTCCTCRARGTRGARCTCRARYTRRPRRTRCSCRACHSRRPRGARCTCRARCSRRPRGTLSLIHI